MSHNEIITQGTLAADGSLHLDDKLDLPPGRVRVVVQALPQALDDDPLWTRLQAIRDIPRTSPNDGGTHTLENAYQVREELEERQKNLEQRQGLDS
jgi:hypothetical protein